MEVENFSKWLKEKKHLKKGTIDSRVSNVRRVNDAYDLEREYLLDGMESILDTFDNAIRDARNGYDPIVNIVIRGSNVKGLRTLKNAIKLYREFKNDDHSERCDTIVGTNNSIHNSCPEVVDTDSTDDPVYVGSIEGFKAYIAAGYRNKVNTWAKRDRLQLNGVCECCGNRAVLQSAHRHGMEFDTIIRRILEKKYKFGEGLYRVNLKKFEFDFKQAHTPIKSVFFFICDECHTKYDRTNDITTEQLEECRRRDGR